MRIITQDRKYDYNYDHLLLFVEFCTIKAKVAMTETVTLGVYDTVEEAQEVFEMVSYNYRDGRGRFFMGGNF